MIIPVNLPLGSYDITIENGVLKKAGSILNLERKVLIVTDSGVPEEYSLKICFGVTTNVLIPSYCSCKRATSFACDKKSSCETITNCTSFSPCKF